MIYHSTVCVHIGDSSYQDIVVVYENNTTILHELYNKTTTYMLSVVVYINFIVQTLIS